MAQKYLFLSATFLLFCLNANAQQRLIALEHNGNSSFFNDIPAAVAAAVSGDIIYLPGGSFPGFGIDKKLTIIGTGHNYPESTSATTMTLISGAITMNNAECDGTVLSGLRIYGDINSNTFENDNVIISRCSVFGIYINGSGGFSENWAISECFIRRIYFMFSSSASNCLIVDYIGALSSQIENNIFLSSSLNPIIATSSTVKNNIFKQINAGIAEIASCLFYNNIFCGGYLPNVAFGSGNSNIGLGNIYHNYTNMELLFNSFTYATYAGNQDNLYPFDFHLINPTYNTGGTDGMPIGIYGGPFPWKAGSIPFNPHILTKSISPTTDPVTGNLNINIQVEAQDH